MHAMSTIRLPPPWCRWFFILLALVMASLPAIAVQHVLVLTSYHAGLNWTEGQLRGLREGLTGNGEQVELHIEFLDTKRVPAEPTYWKQLASQLVAKHRLQHFDMVITQDDDALDFALQQRRPGHWLHGIPLVFSGVASHRTPALAAELDIAGIFDDADIDGNIRLIERIVPKLERILFIHDNGRSAQAQMASALSLADKHPRIRFEAIAGPSLKNLPEHLGNLDPSKTALIILTFNRDADGRTLTHEEAARLIAQAASVPVIAKEDVSMVPGVFGGLMVTSHRQGLEAGLAARRILNGDPASGQGLKQGSTQTVLDYQLLHRFSIDEAHLPPAEWLNRPRSLRETHPREYWLSVALLASLLAIIALLLYLWHRSQRARQALHASEERYRLLLRHSPVGIVHFDLQLKLSFANERFAEILHAPREKLIGFDMASIRDDRPLTACRAALNGEEGHYAGDYFGTLDGQRHWISFRTAPARDGNGRIIGGIGIIEDISARIAAEEKLQQLNEELEERVKARTADLLQANAETQTAMKTLAQSERLAALGSLVAGVAHELNTPIGNAYTVASALRDRIRQLATHVQEGSLKRSTLDKFIANAQEAALLVERNIERAAELIQSFKQVAVDQSSTRRRTFELHQAVSEVLSMLNPRLKRTSISLKVDIPQGILLDSYPGPFDQIIANLIINSLTHAFAEDETGEIQLRAHQDGEFAIVEYTDNGHGMDQATASRAFDPFFTTRLGSGGSGLGLYITRNLATDVLGGSLDLQTAPGEGVHFTLRIPLQAPLELTPENPARPGLETV